MGNKTEKIIVRGTFKTLDASDLEGSIPEVISKLKELNKQSEDSGFKDINLWVEEDYGHISITIDGDRLENDTQFNLRMHSLEMERQSKIIKEAKERREYEKLKEKFG